MSADAFVLDASAVVELLLATPAGERIATHLQGAAGLFAPTHMDAEVFSALARLARHRALDNEVVTDVLEDLADMPIHRVALPSLLTDAWALHDNVAARDALYVVVARRTNATLLTADTRLARAVTDHRLATVWTPA